MWGYRQGRGEVDHWRPQQRTSKRNSTWECPFPPGPFAHHATGTRPSEMLGWPGLSYRALGGATDAAARSTTNLSTILSLCVACHALDRLPAATLQLCQLQLCQLQYPHPSEVLRTASLSNTIPRETCFQTALLWTVLFCCLSVMTPCSLKRAKSSLTPHGGWEVDCKRCWAPRWAKLWPNLWGNQSSCKINNKSQHHSELMCRWLCQIW